MLAGSLHEQRLSSEAPDPDEIGNRSEPNRADLHRCGTFADRGICPLHDAAGLDWSYLDFPLDVWRDRRQFARPLVARTLWLANLDSVHKRFTMGRIFSSALGLSRRARRRIAHLHMSASHPIPVVQAAASAHR